MSLCPPPDPSLVGGCFFFFSFDYVNIDSVNRRDSFGGKQFSNTLTLSVVKRTKTIGVSASGTDRPCRETLDSRRPLMRHLRQIKTIKICFNWRQFLMARFRWFPVFIRFLFATFDHKNETYPLGKYSSGFRQPTTWAQRTLEEQNCPEQFGAVSRQYM